MRGAMSMLSVSCGGALLFVACGSGTPKADSASDVSEASSGSATTKKLDCAFIRSDKNCWRMFTISMGACLGARMSRTGKLSADLTECTLEDDVKVKLGQSCDPDADCDVHDVFMGRGDKKCMEFHSTVTKEASELDRGAGSLEITSSEGTLKLEYDDKTKTLTCPDGSVYSGSGDWKKELSECADAEGYESLPAFAFTKLATVMEGKKRKTPGSVAFELSTLDVLFECAKP